MTLNSMTGFAARAGQADGVEWQWEARSVNARGLDLRIRLPEGLEALEQKLRAAAQARMTRGAVQIALRWSTVDAAARLDINRHALDRALDVTAQIAVAAQEAGVPLAPLSAGDILSMRGVVESARTGDSAAAHVEPIAADIAPLLDDLVRARAAEGAALARVLAGQVDAVAALIADACDLAEARLARSGAALRSRVSALMAAQDQSDPARLAQELALLAVKVDVTEELDRLRAHVDSARALLQDGGPVGRRLDFLMQEFNREANTLCSKAQDSELTKAGLDLKVVIDQMREQCQNVE
ncbi:MAG: YicC/YloC family endoribonuclease [Pseudomonadota bacterium]